MLVKGISLAEERTTMRISLIYTDGITSYHFTLNTELNRLWSHEIPADLPNGTRLVRAYRYA